MSQMLERIRELVARREVRISDHGYDELADDDLFVDDILAGLAAALVVEDYPAYHRVPVSLSFKEMDTVSLFMWYGEFPGMRLHQPLW
jgi:hypothetical protein